MVEMFVYSPRMEGIHLRGGKVARGGIRWSDRREDFRTEVLGLMKAQTVKNAVIVPVGAKGGFVVKRPPAGDDRKALLDEVVECYRTFMRGLLDVTDTIPAARSCPRPTWSRHDDDDPYLVVAADKGTGDVLGHRERDLGRVRVLARRRVRLGRLGRLRPQGDGDHGARRVGVRQAALPRAGRRHRDDRFTVAGIGDMSGDVFGNGMLLSPPHQAGRRVRPPPRLPRPDPDPAACLAERERLFRLPGSSWADYDPALISPGGGVVPAHGKSIPLSPEARAALGIEAEALTPNELIRAVLRAPVDLLWNGGIGTYVKAHDESHAEVGDRANDAVRVDASELRCRVVGEGGNLGFTQRARDRVRARRRPGQHGRHRQLGRRRLLRPRGQHQDPARLDRRRRRPDRQAAERAARRDGGGGGRPRAARQLRAGPGDQLAVAQAVSMAEVHERYIRNLEQTGVLSRELEFLPSDDVLAERRPPAGLTAPEFAILLSHTKIALSAELLASDLPDDSALSRELERYFPTQLRERFGSSCTGIRSGARSSSRAS